MADSGVDGTVKIDTSIDSKGFNAGMAKLSASAQTALGAVLKPLVNIAYTTRQTFEKIGSIIGNVFQVLKKLFLGALLVMALSLSQLFGQIRDSLNEVLKLHGAEATAKGIEDIKNKWEEVKASIALAFLPLLNAAIPYIKAAMDWLIRLFNIVAQITAAFLGQKQVLQVIPGSAEKLAKNTEKTKKAAQGALAAFDQINVLAKQSDTGGASLSDAPKVTAQMVPITDDILAKVQAIKDLIAAWWNDPIGMIKETWGKIVDWFKVNVFQPIADWWNATWLGQVIGKLWDSFKGTWDKLLANTIKTFGDIKDNILKAFNGVKEFLVGVFTGNWVMAWQGLKDIVSGVFGALWDVIQGSLTNWLILFQWLKAQLTPIISGIWDWLKSKALDAWSSIRSTWGAVAAWFTATVANPLRTVFSDALNAIASAFVAIFGGIKTYVLGVINSIIATISTMINAIVDGFNIILGFTSQPQLPSVPGTAGGGTAPSGGGSAGGGSGSIPRLANGAVIPPNSQFLAMLGDQSSGTNIEAPLETIKQAVREVLGGGDLVTVPISLTLDGETIYRNQQRVSIRHGTSLRK